ncbi:MAG: hypothetical protein QW625_00670 [Candidatus Nanoarchaeia archaeon]
MKKLKIFIDGYFCAYKGGISRYYKIILAELAKKNMQIFTTVSKHLKNEFEKNFSKFKNIKTIYLEHKCYNKYIRRINGFLYKIKNSFLLMKLKRKEKIDMFLFVDNFVRAPFLVPKNSVAVLHDIRPLVFKHADSSDPLWYKLLHIFNYVHALLFAKKIICTKTTKKQLLKFFGKKIGRKIAPYTNVFSMTPC